MFDNINPQSNQGGSEGEASSRPEIGQNLGQSSANSAAEKQAGVADMFAETDQPGKPDIFKPKQKDEVLYGQEIEGIPLEMMASSGQGKKIFSLLAVVIGLGVIGTGGYFGLKYFQDNFSETETIGDLDGGAGAGKTEEAEDIGQEQGTDLTDKQAAGTAEEANQTGSETGADGIMTDGGTPDQNVAPGPNMLDTDQDGLTDEEEEILGTSLVNVDTDGDGLSDRQEVKVYHTNPLNADTDNDTYRDGDEVKNGYNPNGPGRLYDINQQQ